MAGNPRNANGSLRKKQRAYWKSRGLPCGICGKPIDYSLGYITDELTGKRRMHPYAFVIDEIVPVARWREGGYSSPEACAQDMSNQRPAHYICNARRGDGTNGSGVIHVVCGAPCSGKTTFVKDNASDGEVIIDLDVIARALGFGQEHGARGNYLRVAQAARRGAIAEVMRRRCGAWIIHTQPTKDELAYYENNGAIVHVLNPGRDECMRRAEADGRPDGTRQAIADWFDRASMSAYVHEVKRGRQSVIMSKPFDDW